VVPCPEELGGAEDELAHDRYTLRLFERSVVRPEVRERTPIADRRGVFLGSEPGRPRRVRDGRLAEEGGDSVLVIDDQLVGKVLVWDMFLQDWNILVVRQLGVVRWVEEDRCLYGRDEA
jgi:hypothetical protein